MTPLALGWLAVAIASSLPNGTYWQIGVWLLVFALFTAYLPTSWMRGTLAQAEGALWRIALFSVLLTFLCTELAPRLLRKGVGWAEGWVGLGQLLMVLGVLAYGRPLARRLPKRALSFRFPAVVAVAGMLGILAIAGLPDPEIDVFDFLNQGVRGLLEGRNPYAMQFNSWFPPDLAYPWDPAYKFDVYSYLPATLLLTIPSVPVDDVRWIMLAAVLISALLMRDVTLRLSASRDVAELVAITFLVYPGSLLVWQHAWVEPLILCLWLAALRVQLAGRHNWGSVFSGLLLGVKQYNLFLLLPIVNAGMGLKGIAASVALPAALCIPFLVWGPRDFWWDTVWYQLQAPERYDALSFSGYLLNEHGTSLPGWLSLGVPLVALAYALWVLRKRPDLARALRLTVGVYLVLFLFSKFAFANYYFLLQAILLVAIGATIGASTAPTEARRTAGPPEVARSLSTSDANSIS